MLYADLQRAREKKKEQEVREELGWQNGDKDKTGSILAWSMLMTFRGERRTCPFITLSPCLADSLGWVFTNPSKSRVALEMKQAHIASELPEWIVTVHPTYLKVQHFVIWSSEQYEFLFGLLSWFVCLCWNRVNHAGEIKHVCSTCKRRSWRGSLRSDAFVKQRGERWECFDKGKPKAGTDVSRSRRSDLDNWHWNSAQAERETEPKACSTIAEEGGVCAW